MKHMLEGMREGKRMKQRALQIVAASLALGIGFDWLFYGKLPGVSVFIYTSLILGTTFYFSEQFKKPLNKSLYWLTPVVLFFALMVFVRANPFLTFVNICLVLYLLLIVMQLARKPTVLLQDYVIVQYLRVFNSAPMAIWREFLQFSSRAIGYRHGVVSKSSVTPYVRGLLFSVPILAIFLLLLSSADLVFKQYVGSLFALDISPETAFRIGLIGFVTSLLMGAYALIFMPSPQPENAALASKKKFSLSMTEASIILGSVTVLFFVFVVIQLAYLFGGDSQVASAGYTYAEYARKGFFELIAVATISLGLILTVKKVTTSATLFQELVFKWQSSVLVAEVLVIMISAHRRLNLYENSYGFTTLRLWSHLFLLWLAVTFVLLMIHVIKATNEKSLAFQMFISVLCFFALINIINPDALIARENMKRFTATGKLDTSYLGNLSEDAVPTTLDLLNSADKNAQKRLTYVLYLQTQSGTQATTHWQSANLARHRADAIARDHSQQIDAGAAFTGSTD